MKTLKCILSIFLTFVLVLSMSMLVSASGGFNQYDRTQKAYWTEYFNSGKELSTSEWMALSSAERDAHDAAYSERLDQNIKSSTTTAAGDDATIIANIKKTYGVAFELGEAGRYDKGAKVTQHLTNIQAGLSYLGSTFTKRVAKNYEDTPEAKAAAAEWGATKPNVGKFLLHLVPRNDAYDYAGRMETNWGLTETNGSRIDLFGYNSSPVTARTTVHEFGHTLEFAVHGKGNAPAPFGDMSGVTYGNGNGVTSGGTTVKSFPADKFVSAYAANSPSEDYAECFTVAVMNGGDKPYTGGKNTVIYKKIKIVYDDLVAFAGSDSRATQRIGAYLGLMP